MRITNGMMVAEMIYDQSQTSQAMATVSQQSASGNLINLPSDNPSGYGTLVSMDASITVMQGWGAVATAAAGNLNAASGALSSASDVLAKAQQIALVASSGTYDVSSRADAAAEMDGLVQQMIGLGNTQGPNGDYLFGGTATGSPPFDTSGAFQGNNGVTQVAVTDGLLVNSNVSGADAFTSAGGGNNVIEDMQALATALSNNDVAGIQNGISSMQADQAQVNGVMVQAGAASSTLEASSQLVATITTSTETARAAVDSAATPQVYSELQATETAYQASLTVTQQILSMQSFAGEEA
jgi:flagellar hook-associated protein 3 FlgL